jgi:RNA-directed DNA polymerase
VNDYVKVRGDKSPFDGDLIYWSLRLSKHPEMPTIKAKFLKQQKGKCAWCSLHFHQSDLLEIDHIKPISCGGRKEWQNLQLLDRHCHDDKTTNDGSSAARVRSPFRYLINLRLTNALNLGKSHSAKSIAISRYTQVS